MYIRSIIPLSPFWLSLFEKISKWTPLVPCKLNLLATQRIYSNATHPKKPIDDHVSTRVKISTLSFQIYKYKAHDLFIVSPFFLLSLTFTVTTTTPFHFSDDKMATLGGVHDSEASQNSVEIENLARFAVDEHNKKEVSKVNVIVIW